MKNDRKYRVLAIEEDLDFGCEERMAAARMAVVTLQEESGVKVQKKQPDEMLYERGIEPGDTVYFDREGRLQKPKMVYFVRHGETIWNVENKICGSTDIELTARGHEQAIETGRQILKAGIKADAILYSPLVRAAETARHISEITGILRREEPRLTEQNFGIWEGTARNGDAFKKEKEKFACRYGTGESMLHLAQRVYNLLDEIRRENRTYILVAHNGISRVVQSYFTDMTNAEYAAFGIRNCQIVAYDFNSPIS